MNLLHLRGIMQWYMKHMNYSSRNNYTKRREDYTMAHIHITAWVLAIIFLFVVTSLYKQGKAKPGKILHMILRLDYLLIIFSGIMLFSQYGSYQTYLLELIIKMLAGLWTIVAIEMITVRTAKGQA